MLLAHEGVTQYFVDYLHYGSALEDLPRILHRLGDEVKPEKSDFLNKLDMSGLCRKRAQFRMISDLVRSFGGRGTESLDLKALDSAVMESERWRGVFRSLGCRGFSFRLTSTPQLRNVQIRRGVNIRIGLLVDSRLYYPPKVRDYLRKESCAPLFFHLANGIGWILGTERYVGEEKYWFVLNIQSDLMKTACASLKDIFRRWQRVLVRLVIELARLEGTSKLAIATSEAVLMSSVWWSGDRMSNSKIQTPMELSRVPGNTPRCWEKLYDETAEAFSMSRVELPVGIDIQVIRDWPSVYRSEFFVLDIDNRKEQGLCERASYERPHPLPGAG